MSTSYGLATSLFQHSVLVYTSTRAQNHLFIWGTFRQNIKLSNQMFIVSKWQEENIKINNTKVNIWYSFSEKLVQFQNNACQALLYCLRSHFSLVSRLSTRLIQHLLSWFDNSLLCTYMCITLAGQSGHPLHIFTDSVQSNMASIRKFSLSRAQLINRYITVGLRLKLSVSTPM